MEPSLHRDLLRAGVSPYALTLPTLLHPVDGVAMDAADAADLRRVCQGVAKRLPADAVFTHWTSALLRGWPLPNVPSPGTIAASHGDAPHLNRRGVYVRRSEIPSAHRTRLGKVSIASAEWTVIDLSEHLTLLDLVALIDGALNREDTTLARLKAAVVKGRRGVRTLRRALALADGRAESPYESHLRLLHVLSGIAVDPQTEVYDEFGVLVGRPDLRIRGTKRLPEYDGEGHRDRARHHRDLRRDQQYVRLGLQRVGYVARDIVERHATIIADAEDALGLPRDPSRPAPFRNALRDSSLSGQGRAALITRLERYVRNESPRKQRQPAPASGASS